MPDDTAHQRFRVPREDRSLLSIPPLKSGGEVVDRNRELFASTGCTLNGRTLADMRLATRHEALDQAHSYTSALFQRQLPKPTHASVVVAGHQPELFHVGVWAKNFALAGIARTSQATAINLIIDNDTLNGTNVRVPVGSHEHPTTDRVPFDTVHPTQPWEETVIRDPQRFDQFGSTVSELIQRSWGFEPLASTAWNAAIRQSRESSCLCDALTAVRSSVEHAWGLENLELPMSKLCETDSFLWFVSHLLMRLPELHAIYNETVADYRRKYHIRNRMQPVPDLESQNGWCEAPFWIWRKGDLHRDRLFARRIGSFCELRNEKTIIARLPVTNIGPLDAAVAVLRELPAQGYRLRTRALTTTLFARVCLADLFIHGIGGAKYDEMTNQLCERLFGLKAPEFLLVSSTLYLPLGGIFEASEAQMHQINHQIRDLTYNPDRHLTSDPDSLALANEKANLLADARSLRGSGQIKGQLTSAQHRKLMEIRAKLLARTAAIRVEYEATRAKIQSDLNANRMLKNRDYSFILYPESLLREFLMPLAS